MLKVIDSQHKIKTTSHNQSKTDKNEKLHDQSFISGSKNFNTKSSIQYFNLSRKSSIAEHNKSRSWVDSEVFNLSTSKVDYSGYSKIK